MTQETQYQLVVRKGPIVGELFLLDLPVMTIGRDPISDIVLNDPEVSRQHARLNRVEDGFAVQDLGSTNGTFIDGERIGGEPVLLQPGQKLDLGSGVSLVFETVSAAASAVDMTHVGSVPELPEEAPVPPPMPPPMSSPPAESVPEAEPAPIYTPPPVRPVDETMGEVQEGKRNTAVIIAIVAVLVLCCCCSFTFFMYQWGGDWLLTYFGLLP